MRRCNFITTGGPLPSFIVGENPLPSNSSSTTANTLYVSPSNPALRTGVLDKVTIYSGNGFAVRVYTGALNTTTRVFAITDSAAFTTSGGKNDYTVSLAINAGDCVGLWSPTTGAGRYGSGSSYWIYSTTSSPTGTITGMTQITGSAIYLQATGS